MNTDRLISQISQKTGLKASQVNHALGQFRNIVSEKLGRNEEVTLPRFGNLFISSYPERTVRDPRNPSRQLHIPAGKIIGFKPSQTLHEALVSIKPKFAAPPTKIFSFSRKVEAPYLELQGKTIAKDVLALLPEQVARHYEVAPIEIQGETLILAMIDPEDQEILELVKKKTGLKIERRLCTLDDLNHVLDQYSGLQTEVEEIVQEKTGGGKPKEEEKKAKEAAAEIEISEEAPAAKIVSSLFKRAVRDKASDIHIEPEEKNVEVRFRIDGVLRKIITLPKDIHSGMVSRIKILANLKIDETRLPQDGRIQMVIDRSEVDFRLSTLPTVNGEKVVARILDKSAGILSLEELGVTGRGFEALQANIKKSHGMILVTGPTGSGKTTTLYAVIDRIRDVAINIVTLEDPVEYRIAGISQCQTNASIGFTFATGLRSIVRQDPDVIMVGEIRDFESASLGVQAALTGHVVLSTLHTNDAAGALPRLIDMKIEPFLITSSVNVIIAQRLCRKICEKCKEPMTIQTESLGEIQEELKKLPQFNRRIDRDLKLFHGKGCPLCNNTGYKGRVGIYEVLEMTEGVKTLVLQRTSSSQITQKATEEGMTTMKQDGILKALEGVTTIEEVLRVTRD